MYSKNWAARRAVSKVQRAFRSRYYIKSAAGIKQQPHQYIEMR